jgi:cytochrome o ubiquinol oxidase subunit 1
MPLYALGLMGATRRMQHYSDPSWRPYMLVAFVGALVILAGIVLTIAQLVVSIRTRERRRVGGDPWDGRTLEWSTPSPPPPWNFATLPRVEEEDAFWAFKYKHKESDRVEIPELEPIEMPRNSALGFVISFFCVVFGFAMVWHIWWMALLGLVGIIATVLIRAWRTTLEFEIPVAAIAAASVNSGAAT